MVSLKVANENEICIKFQKNRKNKNKISFSLLFCGLPTLFQKVKELPTSNSKERKACYEVYHSVAVILITFSKSKCIMNINNMFSISYFEYLTNNIFFQIKSFNLYLHIFALSKNFQH